MEKNFYRPVYDITADAGVEVWGKTPEELICNLVRATVNEMVELSKVEPKEELTLEVESVGFPYLLADVVNEILYIFDVKKFVPSTCEVVRLKEDGTFAVLKLKGERYNPQKHGKKLLIKAATYHGLKMEEKDGKFTARVIFDI